MSDAALNALVIETRNTLSWSPLVDPGDDDQRRDLERRCRAAVEEQPHLELAAWLAGEWTFQRGTDGLRDGLQLVTALLDEKWDQLFVESSGYERDEVCGAQLSALDAHLSRALLTVPVMTSHGLDLRDHLDFRFIARFSEAEMEEYIRLQPERRADDERLALGWSMTLAWFFLEPFDRFREVDRVMNDYSAAAQKRLSYSWTWYDRGSWDLPRTRGMLSCLERAVREAAAWRDVDAPEAQPEQSDESMDVPAQPATGVPGHLDSTVVEPITRAEAVRQLLEATIFICGDDPDGLPCLMLERAVRLAVGSRSGWLAELKQIGQRI